MKKISILLAEDHRVVREGLKMLVNAQPDMEVIAEAGDGYEAVQKALDLKPDVVVMDISMPRLSGARATQQIKQQHPHIHVLALTVHEDKSYLRELLEAGGSGYVLKRSAASDLINAIRIVCNGGIYLDPTLAGQVVNDFIQGEGLPPTEREASLSQRETEVLRFIAQGFSNKEIAVQLDISVKTVETYKMRAAEKLGLHSRADIVRYALRKGWLQD